MQFINLTRHEINEATTGMTIPVSGIEARVNNPTSYLGPIKGVPVFTDNTEAVIIGLPEPVEGVVYIVSNLVLNFCKDRPDVYGVGATIRSDDRQVIACRGFRK